MSTFQDFLTDAPEPQEPTSTFRDFLPELQTGAPLDLEPEVALSAPTPEASQPADLQPSDLQRDLSGEESGFLEQERSRVLSSGKFSPEEIDLGSQDFSNALRSVPESAGFKTGLQLEDFLSSKEPTQTRNKLQRILAKTSGRIGRKTRTIPEGGENPLMAAVRKAKARKEFLAPDKDEGLLTTLLKGGKRYRMAIADELRTLDDGKRGFLDSAADIMENTEDIIPFVKMGKELFKSAVDSDKFPKGDIPFIKDIQDLPSGLDIWKSSKRVASGKFTSQDLENVLEYKINEEKYQNTTLPGIISDGLFDTVPFGIEMALSIAAAPFTGGGSVAAVAGKKVAKETIEEAVKRSVAGKLVHIAGQTAKFTGKKGTHVAQGVLINQPRLWDNVFKEGAAELNLSQDQRNNLAVYMTDTGDDFKKSMIKGFGASYIQYASELLGKFIKFPFGTKEGSEIVDNVLKAGIGRKWLTKAGTRVNRLKQMTDKVPWNNPIQEVLEERAEDLARRFTGLDKELQFPNPLTKEGRNQLISEFVIAGLLGSGIKVVNSADGGNRKSAALNKLSEGIKTMDGLEGKREGFDDAFKQVLGTLHKIFEGDSEALGTLDQEIEALREQVSDDFSGSNAFGIIKSAAADYVNNDMAGTISLKEVSNIKDSLEDKNNTRANQVLSVLNQRLVTAQGPEDLEHIGSLVESLLEAAPELNERVDLVEDINNLVQDIANPQGGIHPELAPLLEGFSRSETRAISEKLGGLNPRTPASLESAVAFIEELQDATPEELGEILGSEQTSDIDNLSDAELGDLSDAELAELSEDVATPTLDPDPLTETIPDTGGQAFQGLAPETSQLTQEESQLSELDETPTFEESVEFLMQEEGLTREQADDFLLSMTEAEVEEFFNRDDFVPTPEPTTTTPTGPELSRIDAETFVDPVASEFFDPGTGTPTGPTTESPELGTALSGLSETEAARFVGEPAPVPTTKPVPATEPAPSAEPTPLAEKSKPKPKSKPAKKPTPKPKPKPKFSKKPNGPEGKGTMASKVVGWANRVSRKWKGGPRSTQVVQSVSDLRAKLPDTDIPDNVRGAYDPSTDTVYLVADNIDNDGIAQFVMLHETVGHKGMEAILGKEADVFFKNLFNARRSEILAHAKKNGNLDSSNELMAREWLADKAGEGNSRKWWQKLMDMVRNWLKKNEMIPFSDEHLDSILKSALKVIEGPSAFDQAQKVTAKVMPRVANEIMFSKTNNTPEEMAAVLKDMADSISKAPPLNKDRRMGDSIGQTYGVAKTTQEKQFNSVMTDLKSEKLGVVGTQVSIRNYINRDVPPEQRSGLQRIFERQKDPTATNLPLFKKQAQKVIADFRARAVRRQEGIKKFDDDIEALKADLETAKDPIRQTQQFIMDNLKGKQKAEAAKELRIAKKASNTNEAAIDVANTMKDNRDKHEVALLNRAAKRSVTDALTRKGKTIWRSEVSPEAKAMLTEVDKVMNMTPSQAEANLIKLAADSEESDKRTAALLFTGFKDKSLVDASQSYSDILSIIETGRTAAQEVIDKRQQDFENRRDQAVKIISGGLGHKTAEQLRKRESFLKPIVNIFRGADDMIQSWEWMLDKLERFDNKSGTLNGELTRHYGRMAFRATRDYDIELLKRGEEMRAKIGELWGEDKNQTILMNSLHDVKRNTKVFRYTPDGKQMSEDSLDLSQMEALTLWMHSKDSSLDENMAHNGYSAKTIRQLDKFLSDESKAYGTWMMDVGYRTIYERVNNVHTDVEGIAIGRRDSFSPLHVKNQDKSKETQIGNFTSSASVNNMHMVNRVDHNHEIDIRPADSNYMDYMTRMEHYIAWAKPMREIRSVLGSKDVLQAIEHHHGRTAKMVISQFIDDFARGGADTSKMVKFIDGIRANFTRSTIGLNPVVFLKQITSPPAYLMDMPAQNWVKGAAYVSQDPLKYARMIKRSDRLQARYRLGHDRDIRLAIKGADSVFPSGTKLGGLQKILNYQMIPTKAGDAAAIVAGGLPALAYHYNEFIKEGWDAKSAEKLALQEFEILTERTQQSGNVKDLGHMQRQGSVANLFTMYMTAPSSYYRQISGGLRNVRAGRGSQVANTKRALIGLVVLPIIFQFVASGLEWDDEDQMYSLMRSPFSGLPIIRTIADALAYQETHDNIRINNLQGTPVLSAPGDIIKGVGQLSEGDIIDGIDEIMSGVSKFSGLAYDPFMRSARGSVKAINGDTNTPIRTAIYGKEFD